MHENCEHQREDEKHLIFGKVQPTALQVYILLRCPLVKTKHLSCDISNSG